MGVVTWLTIPVAAAAAVAVAPAASANPDPLLDNQVFANMYTLRERAGCSGDLKLNYQLTDAAQIFVVDLIDNHDLTGDVAPNGATPADRAAAVGYPGRVAQLEVINWTWHLSPKEAFYRLWDEPASYATMTDCSFTEVGIANQYTQNKTVQVIVYGGP